MDIEYYEEADGIYGLHFPKGIEPTVLLSMMQKAHETLLIEEKKS